MIELNAKPRNSSDAEKAATTFLEEQGTKIDEKILTLPSGKSFNRADVRLVAAVKSVNIDGGEMIVWRKTYIVTDTARYTLKVNPLYSPLFYSALLAVCPRAVGLPNDGAVHLPECPRGTTAESWVASCLSYTQTEIRRQTRGSLLLAITMAIVGIGLVIGIIWIFIQGGEKALEAGGRMWFYLVTASIAALLLSCIFGARAISRFFYRRRVTKAINAMQIFTS